MTVLQTSQPLDDVRLHVVADLKDPGAQPAGSIRRAIHDALVALRLGDGPHHRHRVVDDVAN